MDTKALSEIGLTKGETKVYLALLKLGQSSTGPIAKEAQVSRSKLYVILDKLAKKGLVGSLTKGDVQYFSAMEPKRILQYIDEKKRQFDEQREIVEKMIPMLEMQQKEGRQKAQATLYQGFKAIKNFYLNILDELKAGDTYYVIGATYGENQPGVREFFQNYHSQRLEKKIKVKMLANFDVKDNLVPATEKLSEVRYLPQYLITNMTILFYRKKAFIFLLTKEPNGFLIESEEAVRSFQKYFDTFWKIAKL